MKKSIIMIALMAFCASFAFSQSPSMVFFKGELPDSMYQWPWGFLEDPTVEQGLGYSPGTAAIKWVTSAQDGWQGDFIGLNSNIGNDLSSIWSTDSVYFKMRAPNGLEESDTMYVYLYDSRNADWEYSAWMDIVGFTDLNDGEWHQYSVALADFMMYNNDIDPTDITAVSFETAGPGIQSVLHLDDIWIGYPEIPLTMTFFNGQALGSEVWWEAWGFNNNDLTLAEEEGYTPGTPAIVWETSNWDWQGMGFIMNTHDMTFSFTNDTLKMKIKAPAGINDFAIEWYDNYYYDTYEVARYELAGIDWDGTWKIIEIPLADFTVGEGFVASEVVELGIVASWDTIAERVLFDDIWVGSPTVSIDVTPPPATTGIMADVSNEYINLIAWDDISGESGETYDVYASLGPITNLDANGVVGVAFDIPEGELAVHHIYYPLDEQEISYYYAVISTDAAGNIAEDFGTAGPFANIGRERAIISYEPDFNFVADGDFSEWAGIEPFTMSPDVNLYTGEIDDATDLSVSCYVAMDDTYLYVAFDVFDDVFSWSEENTVDWWDDEAIEFFFGLYELGTPHSYMMSGDEADYRLVFLPNTILWGNGWDMEPGWEDYLFFPLGSSDYIVEARIPFSSIYDEGDAEFTPAEGMTIPFEIFVADSDIPDGGNDARLQLGDNAALNPWGDGPDVWTYAWIGMPDFNPCEHDGDVSGDGSLDVLDVVGIVAHILQTEILPPEYACHGDVDESDGVDILDVVMVVDMILNPARMETSATELKVENANNSVSFTSDGFVGGIQLELNVSDDFEMTLNSNALIADYNRDGTTVNIVIVQPESELFTYTGEMDFVQVLAASVDGYIDVVFAEDFVLLTNYPNPFNPVTRIDYSIPSEGQVNVSIYNLTGQEVTSLVNTVQNRGSYSINWDGSTYPSGLYFVRLETPGASSIHKITLLK